MIASRFLAAAAVAAILLGFSPTLPSLGGLASANDGGGFAEYQRQLLQEQSAAKRRAQQARPPAVRTEEVEQRRIRAVPEPRRPRTVVRRASPPPPRETAPSGMPPAGEDRFVKDQVIVRYQLSARQSQMDDLVRRINLRHLQGRTFALAGVTVHLYEIVDGDPVREVIAALEQDPTVVNAQPNYLYSLLQAAARAESPQYALDRLALAKAHALSTGRGVRVAVIDSQIDSAHSEFRQSVIDLFDVTENEPPTAHAHGTTIAGIIASSGTLLGVAPDAGLIGVRAFLPDRETGVATSTTWRIAAALDQAHKSGARILNMSFAGPEDPLVGRGVAGGQRRGLIAIAAAGNAGPEAPPLYPAAYPGVIAVTATDKDDLVYEKANRGAHIAIAAPGVDILGPVPGGYEIASGTSLAAAHISGLAALLLSRDPSLTAAEVAEILFASAADLGLPGRDPVFGTGVPDAMLAVSASTTKLRN